MKTTAFLIAALAAAVAVPTAGHAARWYESPYFWGGTGLVAGGAVGYALGRDQGRRSSPVHPTYHHAPSPYYTGGPVYYTGGTYTQETRVWPFYRRTTTYPIARTMPLVYQPQAVSLAHPVATYYQHGVYPASATRYSNFAEDAPAREPNQVNVTIGDNNQDVLINIGGSEANGRGNAEEWVTLPLENTTNARLRVEGRMVDVRVRSSDIAEAVSRQQRANAASTPAETPRRDSESAAPQEAETTEAEQ